MTWGFVAQWAVVFLLVIALAVLVDRVLDVVVSVFGRRGHHPECFDYREDDLR